MANGYVCAQCNNVEGVHGFEPDEDGARRSKGFRWSLNSCPGFVYKKKDLELTPPRRSGRRKPEKYINHSVPAILVFKDGRSVVVDIGS